LTSSPSSRVTAAECVVSNPYGESVRASAFRHVDHPPRCSVSRSCAVTPTVHLLDNVGIALFPAATDTSAGVESLQCPSPHSSDDVSVRRKSFSEKLPWSLDARLKEQQDAFIAALDRGCRKSESSNSPTVPSRQCTAGAGTTSSIRTAAVTGTRGAGPDRATGKGQSTAITSSRGEPLPSSTLHSKDKIIAAVSAWTQFVNKKVS
jgi:hypothetical protein